jgi:hypothetical protein
MCGSAKLKVVDDFAFLWEHLIFRRPLTKTLDRSYDSASLITSVKSSSLRNMFRNRWLGAALRVGEIYTEVTFLYSRPTILYFTILLSNAPTDYSAEPIFLAQ